MNEHPIETGSSPKGVMGRDLRSLLPTGTEKWTRRAIYTVIVLCGTVLVVWYRDAPWKETDDWLPFVFFGLFLLTAFYTYVVLQVDRIAGWSVFACGLAISQMQVIVRYDSPPRVALMLAISNLLLIAAALAHDVEYAKRRALELERDRRGIRSPEIAAEGTPQATD